MPLDFIAKISGFEADSVEDSRGRTGPARSEIFEHKSGESVELDTGSGGATESVEFTAPDRGSDVTVHVQEWDGAGHVRIEFLDEPGGNEITQRDQNDKSTYATDGTSDVFVSTTIPSPYVRVEIVDDSGASNVVDYNIYAR